MAAGLIMRKKTSPPIPVLQYGACPAKTYLKPTGEKLPGRTVLNHCTIVGEVARELIRRFPPELAKALFPKGAPLVAAAHDIGKVSPTFYEKIRRACAPELTALDPLPNINPNLESEWGGHAGVSQLTAKVIDT